MMKMTRSTSITSISGIILISAIGASAPLRRNPPNAMSDSLSLRDSLPERQHRTAIADVRAGAQHGKEIVRKTVECGERDAVRAHECVVGQHRGDRDHQSEGGHDERLADGPRDLVERALAAHPDIDERVIDRPYGAEQSDEGCGAPDRSEHCKARF